MAQQQRVGPHPGGGGPPVGGGPGDDLAARTAHQQQVATFISTQPRCMESGASSLDGNESTVSHLSGMSSATSTPPSMSPPPTQDCVPIAQTVGGDRQAQGGAAGYTKAEDMAVTNINDGAMVASEANQVLARSPADEEAKIACPVSSKALQEALQEAQRAVEAVAATEKRLRRTSGSSRAPA